MEHLIDFNPKTAEVYSQVVVPPELGLEHILKAVKRVGMPQYNALLRMRHLGHFEKDEVWYQVGYPGPVMHLVRHNKGFIVEVYSNGNGTSANNSWELTKYLSSISSNGDMG